MAFLGQVIEGKFTNRYGQEKTGRLEEKVDGAWQLSLDNLPLSATAHIALNPADHVALMSGFTGEASDIATFVESATQLLASHCKADDPSAKLVKTFALMTPEQQAELPHQDKPDDFKRGGSDGLYIMKDPTHLSDKAQAALTDAVKASVDEVIDLKTQDIEVATAAYHRLIAQTYWGDDHTPEQCKQKIKDASHVFAIKNTAGEIASFVHTIETNEAIYVSDAVTNTADRENKLFLPLMEKIRRTAAEAGKQIVFLAASKGDIDVDRLRTAYADFGCTLCEKGSGADVAFCYRKYGRSIEPTNQLHSTTAPSTMSAMRGVIVPHPAIMP